MSHTGMMMMVFFASLHTSSAWKGREPYDGAKLKNISHLGTRKIWYIWKNCFFNCSMSRCEEVKLRSTSQWSVNASSLTCICFKVFIPPLHKVYPLKLPAWYVTFSWKMYYFQMQHVWERVFFFPFPEIQLMHWVSPALHTLQTLESK